MDSCNLSYTLDPEQRKTLSSLARRCRDINGWGSRELLQYAATTNTFAEIYSLNHMVLDGEQYDFVKL